jgi:hypothetical protein
MKNECDKKDKTMKNHIIGLLPLICLLTGICIGEETAKTKQDANQSLSADRVIATVLGKNISSGDIEPSAETLEKNKGTMSEKQFNQWHKQYQESRLHELIFGSLRKKYAEENRIDANDAEVEEFYKAMKRNMARTAAEWRQARNDLAKQLENPDFNDIRKKEIKSQLDSFDKSIEHMERAFTAPRNGPAQTMIRGWKTNKSLFEKYGGRVIFQQAGPEPLDAYRDFLKEQQAAGNFEIKDKETAALFWNYFTNDKMHTFYKDPNEAKKFMKTPFWLMEPEKAQTKQPKYKNEAQLKR